MTYISRGTRLNVSRWLDECDAEYELRACRKRSDGRLKRHTSCDDLRAWVSNNCVNHEYLVDLMSDGEATGKSHVRLYGRYIPVPVLLKLSQDLKNGNSEVDAGNMKTNAGNNVKNEKGKDIGSEKNGGLGEKSGINRKNLNKTPSTQITENSEDDGDDVDDDEFHNGGDENLWKTQCEKYLLEKKFFQCRSLLCKAVGKLEKIDNLICGANEDADNSRNEEIESAFQSAKSVCNCSVGSSPSPSYSPSRPSLRKANDDAKYSEVRRKIVDLKQKLKAIAERRQEVDEQIRQDRYDSRCGSVQQLTELYNRIKSRRLQKKLEKLVAEKGKILQELTDAVRALNTLKKSTAKSRSRMSFFSSASHPNDEEFHFGTAVTCGCGCQIRENFDLSISEMSQDEFSIDTKQTEKEYFYSPEIENNNSPRQRDEYGNSNLGANDNTEENWSPRRNSSKNSHSYNQSNFETPNSLTPKMGPSQVLQTTEETGEGSGKIRKKSKLRFVCPEKSCKKRSENFENYGIYDEGQNIFFAQLQEPSDQYQAISQQQRQQGVPEQHWQQQQQSQVQDKQWRRQGEQENNWKEKQNQKRNSSIVSDTSPRPKTTPTSKIRMSTNKIPGRKIKSETTMEEIEKALRNYEQRLQSLDCLEYKIVKMQERLWEGNRQKEELLKQRVERKRMRAVEKEKSTKLCSENWALKKKVRELMAVSDVQMKKIECLKMSKRKLRETECETEELKKALCEYQNGYNGQKERICMLETCVVSQRKQIEELTSLINCLKTGKNLERNRSYSLESLKRTSANCAIRQSVQGPGCGKLSQSEEDDGCCCEEWHQQRITGMRCCSPQSVRRKGRGVN